MGGVYLDISALLSYTGKASDDEYVKSGLESAYEQYRQHRRAGLCKVKPIVDSIDYPNIYQPLDFFPEVGELRLHFEEPDIRKSWDYNRPTLELTLKKDGRGGSLSFRYDPERFDNWEHPEGLGRHPLMYSIFITKGFEPVTLAEATERLQSPDSMLTSPPHNLLSFWNTVRSGKVIPFEVRICIYTKTSRWLYDIDLVRNRLLPDFRNGRVAARNVIERQPLETMYFDRIWAGLDIPQLNRDVFLLLFHSDGLTPQEVSVVMGINYNMALNHLKSLEARGLARVGRTGNLYTPATEDFKKIAEELIFS